MICLSTSIDALASCEDVTFTGKPAGVGNVAPEDILTGLLEGEKAFEVKVK